MNKIFAIIIIMQLSLFSQILTLKQGWNLVGAIEDIQDISIFEEKSCGKNIFTYRDDKFIRDDAIDSIQQAEGFWVFSMQSCTIDTNANEDFMDEDFPDENQNIPDETPKEKVTNKLMKVYMIKAKDTPFINNKDTPFANNKDVAIPIDDEVLSKTIKSVYAKEIYQEYIDEVSFGNLQVDFVKGSVLEIDSYPIEETNAQNKDYEFSAIDILKLTDIVKKMIPKEDYLKYDPIIFHIIASEKTQYSSSGVAIPHSIKIDGKERESVFVMFQILNEGITVALEEFKEETLIDSTRSTVLHELFHSFGFLRHASSVENNQLIEYGNAFDVLGGGSISINLNPGVRDTFKWLDDSNTIYIDGNKAQSKNITLYPLNGKTGKRVVRISAKGTTKYYLSFLGDDKWFITALKPDEELSEYGGFGETLTKALVNENKKGLFIIKEDGDSNVIIRHKDKSTIPSFRKGDTYHNKFFTIDGISVKDNGSINFDIRVK